MLVLSVVGIAISSYLAYAKLTSNPLICAGNQGCNTVQNSEYSTILGIPLGIFGMAYYFILFTLIYTDSEIIKKYKSISLWIIWGILFSSYLTYLEAFVIEAYCIWCLGSFFNILLIGFIYFTFGTKVKTQSSASNIKSDAESEK